MQAEYRFACSPGRVLGGLTNAQPAHARATTTTPRFLNFPLCCLAPRRYFLSCFKLNLATGIEIMTFLAPQYFLLMGAVANTIKARA